MNSDGREVPVKVFRSESRVTVAAPVPGMEPQDIFINVTEDGSLTLTGESRGALKGENEILMDEWNPGPYQRSIQLQSSVDATRANATYNNGVLVVSLPISDSMRPASIELERLSATQGRQEGNAGSPA